MPTTDKTVKAAQDRKHYLKTRERRLAYQREYSRRYNEKLRRARGTRPRVDLSGLTDEQRRERHRETERARFARMCEFDPAGTLPLLRRFMTTPIVHPPRAHEPVYAQIVSRSSNSRMETKAQRVGECQTARA